MSTSSTCSTSWRTATSRKEGVPKVLTTLAEDPSLSAAEAVEEAGLSGVSEAEVREAVVEVVERNADQIEAEGMGAFSGLMGEAMGARSAGRPTARSSPTCCARRSASGRRRRGAVVYKSLLLAVW